MERVREVIVSTSASGSATRISDIANVYRAAVSPPRSMAMAQGREAILIGVVMESGNQVDAWSVTFNEFVASYRESAPAGLDLQVSYDQNTYATSRLFDVATNLAIGVALVILVLLLRWAGARPSWSPVYCRCADSYPSQSWSAWDWPCTRCRSVA